MFGTMISNMMVKPGQSPLFDKPEDHGLEYENVEFKTEDAVTLRGWLINGGSDKVIVQTHFGVQCNRGGWTPKGARTNHAMEAGHSISYVRQNTWWVRDTRF